MMDTVDDHLGNVGSEWPTERLNTAVAVYNDLTPQPLQGVHLHPIAPMH